MHKARGAAGRRYRVDWLRFLIAHESTLLVQFQVSGVLPPGSSQRYMVRREGPVWLQEGYAQVFANTVATTATEATYRDIMVSRYKGSPLPDLATLEERRALDVSKQDVYRAGAIATADLNEAKGYAAMGQLFEALGEGIPWETAFENAFGQSPADFYADFRKRPRT